MKVALIGNMNNNNFAFLRYLLDLGVDAHLLLFKEDGRFSAAHFAHECDTYYPERYNARIKRIEVSNHYSAVLSNNLIYRILFSLMYLVARVIKIPHAIVYKPLNLAKQQEIKSLLSGYDVLVGSGYSPAILATLDVCLTVFYPYSTGVEGVGSVDERVGIGRSRFKFWLTFPFYLLCRRAQISALKEARILIASDGEASVKTFKEKIGRDARALSIPFVYLNEKIPESIPSHLESIYLQISQHDVVFIAHARHLWKCANGLDQEEFFKTSKNNDWIFEAFALLVGQKRGVSSLLITFDYGADASASKKLCGRLSIEDSVLWLPTMARKDILRILSWCSAGIGEFYSEPVLWGGTGWETLAAGKPLIQGFMYEDDMFEKQFGYPPPPVLKVRGRKDVLDSLLLIADNPEKANKIGVASRQWFDTYNGISLAKAWVKLFEESTFADEIGI